MRVIDILGNEIELDMDEDDVILDAVVLLRVTKFDSEPGTSQMIYAATDNTDFVVQLGMFHSALLEMSAE